MSDEQRKQMTSGLMMAIWDYLSIKNQVPVTGYMARKVERIAAEIIEAIESFQALERKKT